MPEPPITASATIISVVTPGRLFEVELKNGLKIPAHLGRKAGSTATNRCLSPGDQVNLEFTPYDFSKARIACQTSV